MRRIFYFLTFLLLTYPVKAQVNQISVGAPNVTLVFNSVKYDPSDGGTINVGYVNDPASGRGNDCFMVKLNASQQIVWQKIIPNNGDEYFNQVTICSNGDYLAVGRINQSGILRGLACRINKNNGSIIWASRSGVSSIGDIFHDVVETTNGNIAISGTDSYLPGSTNVFIILLNASGSTLWTKVSSHPNSDEPLAINQLPNGNLIVAAFDWVGSYYKAAILELNELTGATLVQNVYTINTPSPNSGLTLNSLFPTSLKIINGVVSINMNAFQGSTSNANMCIYTYDQVTKQLSGNIYYHTGDINAIGYAYYPLGNNDFLTAQSFASPNRVYVSRITNGAVVYDRLLGNGVLSITGIDTTSANSVYSGKAVYNSFTGTFNLFSPRSVPAQSAPCPVTNSNTLALQSSVLTAAASGDIALSTATVLTSISLTSQATSYALNNICGSCTPTIDITASSSSICAGSLVMFTTAVTNSGSSPVYQWKINGVNAGTNAGSFSTTSLQNNDTVICILTANPPCLANSLSVSDTIVVSVNNIVQPAITITAANNPICSGTSVTFTATAINGGNSPSYQWKKNAVNVGANNITYIDNNLNNGDMISCVLTSGNSCVTSPTVTSNTVVMNITPLITPAVTIASDLVTICYGQPVNFSATITNGGTSPIYQWKKNNLNVGSNTSTFTDNSISNGDMITCTVTSNGNCLTVSVAISNTIAITVHQNPIVSLDHSTTLCMGSIRQLSAGNFSSYLWNDQSTGSILSVSGPGTYYVSVTDNNGCKGSDTTHIKSMVPLPAGFLAGDTAVCSYSSVLLNTQTSYKTYLWNTNSSNTSINVTQPGIYWLEVTDYNNCKGRDSIIIFPKDCLAGFYIPNAFTPNNDGKNELFKPFLLGNLTRYSFSIYNRLGQQIFTSADNAQGWDGKVKGKLQEPNVFIWTCTYQFENEPLKVEKGTFTLIR